MICCYRLTLLQCAGCILFSLFLHLLQLISSALQLLEYGALHWKKPGIQFISSEIKYSKYITSKSRPLPGDVVIVVQSSGILSQLLPSRFAPLLGSLPIPDRQKREQKRAQLTKMSFN